MSNHALSTRLLVVAFAAGVLLFLAATAPAALIPALAGGAFSVEDSQGTIWRGRLFGVSSRGVSIGNATFEAQPFSVLVGRFAGKVDFRDGALVGSGAIAFGIGDVEVQGARFVFDLEALGADYAVLGAPLRGTVRADIGVVRLSRNGCSRGRLTLWTDVLVAPAKRLGGDAFSLSGDGQCKNGNVELVLAGHGSDGGVSMTIRVSPDFTYRLTAEAQPVRAEVADALQLFGFERMNGALTLATTGALSGT